MGETSILEKFQRLDNRIIYGILLACLILPYVRPIGLPITVSWEARAYWEKLTTMPEESIILINLSSDPSTIPQTRSAHQITILELFKRNCKIVFITLRDDAPPLHEEMMQWVLARVPSSQEPVYGVDYVNLGYFPPGDATMAALATDIEGFAVDDAYGNPLGTLSMMDNINDGGDFDYVFWNDGSRGHAGSFLTQWQDLWGTGASIIAVSLSKPGIMVNIQAGFYDGAVLGVTGSGMLEILSGYLGDATKATEPGSLATVVITILILISNALYWIQRLGGKER